MNKVKIALLTLLMATGLLGAKAQSVSISPAVICQGSLTTLCVTGYTPPAGISVSGYKFDLFNNGVGVITTPSTQPCYTNPYAPGSYTAKVTVLLSNSTSVDMPLANITVYNLPVINMGVTSQDTQCFRGNYFCFSNLCQQNPNAPSNPLKTYYWNYGDASGDSLFNTNGPCHTYNSPITKITGIDVLLSATDTKGCRKDSLFKGTIALKPNIAPNFKWTFLSGPCFITCYQFKNTGVAPANQIQTYEWDFGDGYRFTGSGLNDPDNHFDTIMHCYKKDGQFSPALTLTDLTGCIDSTRKKNNNTTQALPANINFQFDIIATKSALDSVQRRDTVCSGSGNSKFICYRMTPVSFAQGGAGDFVWNFGDPNDPQQKNLDSVLWNPCHQYSGMGTFFPRITIKNVCPDTTFIYRSTIATYSRLDSALYPDNDWGPNPTPPPGTQTLAFKFRDPLDVQDSVTLYYTHTVRPVPQLREAGTIDTTAHAYTTKSRDRIIWFRRLYPAIDVIGPDTFLKDSIRLPETYIFQFNRVPGATKPLYHKYNAATNSYDSVYAYQMDFTRPNVLFKKSYLISDTTTGDVINPVSYMYYKFLNSFNMQSYGVEVIGPSAGIEAPPVPIVIKQSQKNQCGPTDTIDFVNTSSYFKSRKVWRRWDFDDNFAPQCTSFSVPRRGFPQPSPIPGRWGVGAWATAMDQDFGSDHFFIANGVIYPGRMSCKFSFDTLPRYSYPNWDTVYQWYRYGHDFMPWNFAQWDTVPSAKFQVLPGDRKWWGKPVYLNIATGEWSLNPGTTVMQHMIKSYIYKNPINGQNSVRYYVDTIPTASAPNVITVDWPRIDTMALRTNNAADLQPGSRLQIVNIPDPIGLARGKYVILNGPQIDLLGPTFQVNNKGDSWIIAPTTPIPGGGDFYEYVFRRTIQRCLTVKQRLRDSVNNESYTPGGPVDSIVLDDYDCWDEATAQLALGKADARGLAISGKLCPGLTTNAFGANVRFSFSANGKYPGIQPACGQTFVMFNYDSLADRKDLTPCDIDGFVSWTGGTTAGGNTWPPMFSGTDFNPMTIWTSPGGTTFIYHYGFGSGTPPPADTANGWITVGLQIGNGCKDYSRTNILMSQYRANLGVYQGNVTTAPYDYAFNRIYNLRPLTPGIPDTLVDIEYVDCNFPRCTSSPIWYHNFLRIINLSAQFEEFPQQLPPNVWKLRGKGETITVMYQDSVQDSVKYDSWQWGDATVTVDSFWYAGDDTTNDGFYTNGMRRVRYNWDMINPGSPFIMDSTVWPIRASYPGANDGLRPRTPGKFKAVSYDTLDYCTGKGKAFPSFVIVDTAMMFLPISHQYVRTSWEADNRINPYKGPDANITPMIHFIVSTAGCQQFAGKYITIGVIDTFETKNAQGLSDSVFCVNEPVYFYDSVRYWRYDASVTSLPFNPGGTRNPTQGAPPYSFLTFGFPENLMQIDTFDFWRYREFDPFDFKGQIYRDSIYKWNLGNNQMDTIRSADSVFTERIYWDFGDGTFPFAMGKSPVHKYDGYGRYKVSMFSRDSMGFWDTCVRYVNVVRPVARIGLQQDVYNCGVPAVPMWDSSYIIFGTGPTSTDFVKLQYWWFGDNSKDTINPFVPATGNPKPEYPYRSNGLFKVKMVVETDQGCFDTTTRNIFIKGPRPHIKLLTDTAACAPYTATVLNLADSFDKQAPNDTPTRVTRIWWGDGSQDTILGRVTTKSHLYTQPGTYSIYVFGSDEDPNTGIGTCTPTLFPDTIDGKNPPIHVNIYKFPVDLSVSKTNVCQNETFQIKNNSDTSFYGFHYDFYKDNIANGPGVDQSGQSPNTVDKSFPTFGKYIIKGFPNQFGPAIPVTARANCIIVDSMEVNVYKASPSFYVDTTEVPLMKFVNVSTDSNYYYNWVLTNSAGATLGTYSGNINDKNWFYDLKDDTGSFKICLTAFTYDTLGHCEDSICKPIYTNFLKKLTVPNVFSPNGDGKNDFFKIIIEGQTKYDLSIFNRWGDKVFESIDATKLWNGSDLNDGKECAPGVYFYVFNYKYRGEETMHTLTGTITLIKEQ